MLISSAFFAAIAVVLVGVLIVWSNPVNWVNRLVCTCSVHIAIWLGFLHMALVTKDGLLWLRWATSVSALIPFHFWLVKEAIAGGMVGLNGVSLSGMIRWLASSLLFVAIPFTDYFVPSYSTAENRIYGVGYYFYIIGVFCLYAALGFDTYRRIRVLSGGQRLALQVWLGGGCATAAAIIILMVANAITHDSTYIKIQPFVVLTYYAATSFAITTHRIFNARQLFLVGVEKTLFVATVAAGAYLLDVGLKLFLPEPFAFLVTTGLILWFAVSLNAWLDSVFRFYPQATSARQACFLAAQNETKSDQMVKAFEKILKGWGQTDSALILSGDKDVSGGDGGEVSAGSAILSTMAQLRWATPERLSRERPSEERLILGRFLAEHGLGALVIAEGPALTTLIGVGVGASRRPYTYPQVMQLMELASIMESALERAHFSARVQHTEQLATVGLLGASLAHEIRNPLVSIKTFVQLLPTHYQDPRFREKFFHLIGSEVTRIDQLTEQLLDLASPRSYAAAMHELHLVLQPGLELVAAKAADKGVQFITDFQASPDLVCTDPAAAKQVLLNLCFNAIQAVDEHGTQGDRWVRIATRNVPGGVELAVSDSGPGIAPEIQQRLFQPFQTTKSTGFGLGLAICRDILANLGASISVDAPQSGRGATFRVVYPCQVSSS